ncbi:MAG: hypothetical protein U0531_18425 [Dehalococcoidia bacterium]
MTAGPPSDVPLPMRRTLLRAAFWGALGATSAGAGAATLAFLRPAVVSGFGATIVVRPGAIPEPGGPPAPFRAERFFLVHLLPGEGANRYIDTGIPPSERGGVLALHDAYHGRCDYGRRVVWRGDFHYYGTDGVFQDPCDHSRFSKAGIRIIGSAATSTRWRSPCAPTGRAAHSHGALRPGGDDNPRGAILPGTVRAPFAARGDWAVAGRRRAVPAAVWPLRRAYHVLERRWDRRRKEPMGSPVDDPRR